MDSPYIVNQLDVIEDAGKIQIVTEFCEHGELLDHILSSKNLTENTVKHIMRQLLTGLNHLHSQHIIHRDIKLENILIKNIKKLEIRIIDLGFGTKQFKQNQDEILGTPQQMAPEVFTSAIQSPESDIWSAGVCMYAMLSGKMPFHQRDSEKINVLFKRIKTDAIDFSGECWQKVSNDAKDLILKMLQKKAKQRISIKDALDHPFFTESTEDIQLDSVTIENLRKWKESSAIIKAQRIFMARIIASKNSSSDESGHNAEQIDNLKRCFEAIDTDHSGEISSEEFQKAFQTMGSISVDEVETIVKSIDVNGNGMVNQTEFLAGCISYKNQKQDEILLMLFNTIDIDGSQTIDKNELKQQLLKQQYIVSDEQLEEKFKQYSQNGVELSYNEFKRLHNEEIFD